MVTDKERYTATLTQLRPKEIERRRAGRLVVSIEESGGSLREAVLEGLRISGGAHGKNDLVLSDPTVTSVHFEFVVNGEQVFLRDLGSKNGTWIPCGEGSKVGVRNVRLVPGSRFVVGPYTLTLRQIEATAVAVSTEGTFGQLRGKGSQMGELFAKLERLAPLDLSMLVLGETGTGKELVAEAMHARSPRSNGPFIVVDCTNINEGIAESTLFGHRKGAFTGADSDQPGLVEKADGGTLFIDEIGELPLALQPKLLRAIETSRTRRVGESQYREFDARIIAATKRDLSKMIAEDKFRDDLYFRLAEVKVELPPLRERGSGDILMLADLFLDRVATERGMSLAFDRAVYEQFAAYAWPGNVRELRNVVRYASMLAHGGVVRTSDLPALGVTSNTRAAAGRPAQRNVELEQALLMPAAEARLAFERVYASRLLAETGGNQSEAARRAGMSRSAFRDLLKRASLVESGERDP